jgi:hypothetical protein
VLDIKILIKTWNGEVHRVRQDHGLVVKHLLTDTLTPIEQVLVGRTIGTIVLGKGNHQRIAGRYLGQDRSWTTRDGPVPPPCPR